jgi:restriction endonuclease S subunit
MELMHHAETASRFIDCVDVLYGFPFNSKLFNTVGDGTPLIRIRDINTGFSETYTTEVADEKYIIHHGDCIVGMDGNFEIVKWAHQDAYLNQRACKMTPRTICREYMRYYLQITLKKIEGNAQVTTVKHLSAKDINNMMLPVPAWDAQLVFEEFSLRSDKSKFVNVRNLVIYRMLGGIYPSPRILNLNQWS